jgi:hypothetical protein
MNNYILGAEFSRQSFLKGGACIFIQKHLPFSIVNIEKFCKDKELEACALRLDFLSSKICVITVYRSPNGDFQYFIKGLDNIINRINKPGVQLIICGDININYLTESKEKHELNNILNSYNLVSVINFPTRIKNNSSSTIDNIFLDATKLGRYSTFPVVNGLSDHDAQMLELQVGNLKTYKNKYQTLTIRKIDFNSLNEFKDKLSSELWQNVFENYNNNDVNSIFNSFLNVYLQIFYTCFPKITVNRTTSNNQWITKGILNSCKRKKELYLLIRNNNNTQLKELYRRYNKILTRVIRAAKILHHNNQIIHSNNTIKTTWNIIKNETGGNNTKYNTNTLNSDRAYNKSINAESFNKYFLTVAGNISCKIKGSKKQAFSCTKDSLSYLDQVFNHPFTNMVFHNTSTGEIEKIINSLPWKNSSGYDEISVRILKASAPFISSPLCRIINTSLNTGVFPNRLKYSIITPIHKKVTKIMCLTTDQFHY